jgi:hypothetical protein
MSGLGNGPPVVQPGVPSVPAPSSASWLSRVLAMLTSLQAEITGVQPAAQPRVRRRRWDVGPSPAQVPAAPPRAVSPARASVAAAAGVAPASAVPTVAGAPSMPSPSMERAGVAPRPPPDCVHITDEEPVPSSAAVAAATATRAMSAEVARLESAAAAKSAELTALRAQLRSAQQASVSVSVPPVGADTLGALRSGKIKLPPPQQYSDRCKQDGRRSATFLANVHTFAVYSGVDPVAVFHTFLRGSIREEWEDVKAVWSHDHPLSPMDWSDVRDRFSRLIGDHLRDPKGEARDLVSAGTELCQKDEESVAVYAARFNTALAPIRAETADAMQVVYFMRGVRKDLRDAAGTPHEGGSWPTLEAAQKAVLGADKRRSVADPVAKRPRTAAPVQALAALTAYTDDSYNYDVAADVVHHAAPLRYNRAANPAAGPSRPPPKRKPADSALPSVLVPADASYTARVQAACDYLTTNRELLFTEHRCFNCGGPHNRRDCRGDGFVLRSCCVQLKDVTAALRAANAVTNPPG